MSATPQASCATTADAGCRHARPLTRRDGREARAVSTTPSCWVRLALQLACAACMRVDLFDSDSPSVSCVWSQQAKPKPAICKDFTDGRSTQNMTLCPPSPQPVAPLCALADTGCPAGRGGPSCELCGNGTFANFTSTGSRQTCQPCENGTSTAGPGAAWCSICGAGRGGAACEACPASTYSEGNLPDRSTCTTCPPSYAAPATGSTSCTREFRGVRHMPLRWHTMPSPLSCSTPAPARAHACPAHAHKHACMCTHPASDAHPQALAQQSHDHTCHTRTDHLQ